MQRGDGDLRQLLPVAEQLDAVRDGVADVEGLHGAVEEVGDEAVERGLRELGGIAAGDEDGLKFGLAAEESVEEVSEPGDGEKGRRGRGSVVGGGGGGGGEEVGEAGGDVFLEEVEVFLFLVVGGLDGGDLVAANAD